MKNKYDKIKKTISEIVIKHDPMGLLEQGAPEDEYDLEISKLVPLLVKCNSLVEISDSVNKVFKKNYDLADDLVNDKSDIIIELAKILQNDSI